MWLSPRALLLRGICIALVLAAPAMPKGDGEDPPPLCSFAIVDVHGWSNSQLQMYAKQLHRNLTKPVLFTNTATPSLLSQAERESFLSRYSNLSLVVSMDMEKQSTTGVKQRPWHTTIGAWVESFWRNNTVPRYTFTWMRESTSLEAGNKMFREFGVPRLTRWASSNLFWVLGDGDYGVRTHAHGTTWLHLLAGVKTWYVLEPEIDASAPHPAYGKTQTEEQLQNQGFQRCVQTPGTVLLLPAQYWHATFDSGWTLGIGAQMEKNVGVVSSAEFAATTGDVAALKSEKDRGSLVQALHAAIHAGQAEVLETLLAQGAHRHNQVLQQEKGVPAAQQNDNLWMTGVPQHSTAQHVTTRHNKVCEVDVLAAINGPIGGIWQDRSKEQALQTQRIVDLLSAAHCTPSRQAILVTVTPLLQNA